MTRVRNDEFRGRVFVLTALVIAGPALADESRYRIQEIAEGVYAALQPAAERCEQARGELRQLLAICASRRTARTTEEERI